MVKTTGWTPHVQYTFLEQRKYIDVQNKLVRQKMQRQPLYHRIEMHGKFLPQAMGDDFFRITTTLIVSV